MYAGVIFSKIVAFFGLTRSVPVEVYEIHAVVDEWRSETKLIVEYRNGWWDPWAQIGEDELYYLVGEGEAQRGFVIDVRGKDRVPILIRVMTQYLEDSYSYNGYIKFYFGRVLQSGRSTFRTEVLPGWVYNMQVEDVVAGFVTIWLNTGGEDYIKLHQVTNCLMAEVTGTGRKTRVPFLLAVSTKSNIKPVMQQNKIADDEVVIPIRDALIETWPD